MATVPTSFNPGDSGTYWQGADGQVYVSGNNGINAAGAWDANSDAYWGGQGFRRTADPVTGDNWATQQETSSTNTTNYPSAPSGGGGSGTPAPIFNQAGADNTQKTIGELPGLLQAALAAENARYGNAISGFDTQEQTQRGQYGESTTTNQQNYDANFMDSIRAGIQGLGGLMQLLRGTGAAGGTAEDEVKDIVGGVTSKDIRQGADVREENQTGLDRSFSTFLTDLKGKRERNEDTKVNNQRAIRADSDTQLQELYGKMAGFYSDVDNQPEYNKWMTKAGGLTPSIAQNSRTKVSDYDSTPVSVKAPQLTAFQKPTQPTVRAGNSSQLGSGIFTISEPGDQEREEERNQVPVAAGA